MPVRTPFAALAASTAFLVVAGAALISQGAGAAAGAASPDDAVSGLLARVTAGDADACALLTPEARDAFLADTDLPSSCPEAVAVLGRQTWLDPLSTGTTTVTVAARDHAVVRLDLPDASVLWFRAVPSPGGWLVARGPWDVRQV